MERPSFESEPLGDKKNVNLAGVTVVGVGVAVGGVVGAAVGAGLLGKLNLPGAKAAGGYQPRMFGQ